MNSQAHVGGFLEDFQFVKMAIASTNDAVDDQLFSIQVRENLEGFECPVICVFTTEGHQDSSGLLDDVFGWIRDRVEFAAQQRERRPGKNFRCARLLIIFGCRVSVLVDNDISVFMTGVLVIVDDDQSTTCGRKFSLIVIVKLISIQYDPVGFQFPCNLSGLRGIQAVAQSVVETIIVKTFGLDFCD